MKATSFNQKLNRLFKENWGFMLFVLLLISSRSSIADWYQVPTGSMLPTIEEGDRIFVDKMAYRLDIPFTDIPLLETGSPARGDIVVFMSEAANIRLVKRVIGLPGDNIAMVNNQVVLNGQIIQYEKINSPALYSENLLGYQHPVQFVDVPNPRDSFKNIVVPKGFYFVMGDNRNNSVDSRYYGFIPKDELLGRATNVMYSLDTDNYYLPKAERFWKPLI